MNTVRWLCPFCDYSTGPVTSYSGTAAKFQLEILVEQHIDDHVEQMMEPDAD